MNKAKVFSKVLKNFIIVTICCAFVLLSAGGGNVKAPAPEKSVGTAADPRDTEASVLVPEAPGTETLGNEKVVIDISNVAQGYVSVHYAGDNDRVKLQVSCDGGEKYTYNLQKGTVDVFPLTQGNGTYWFGVFENTQGDSYHKLYSGEKAVTLENEFLPFLYPNQYVDFTPGSAAVAQGEKLAKEATDDLELVEKVYNYVVENVSYDYEKADNVENGYLPDVDETLQTKKGICFDYAALMTTMLRSQRIPTRLVIGYVGDLYHAWISVYIEGQGWIDNIIYFDGTQWTRMDPTLASTSGQAKEYTGDGNEYHEMYTY
ncbi:MAG: transglutaminase-like domain-containing protein [Christensenella sp.]|uniref:transglutaminase-like domain-containing protein n=1 Tax=Christensenella sp. TaxID=1935934 RepID=UPI002B1FF7F1|nr:transglutaminase-like domain-containing protein [Christensenella sp.]MEA5002676.1 transglutaminase-like domain-containing protein [Christensenella sp.]